MSLITIQVGRRGMRSRAGDLAPTFRRMDTFLGEFERLETFQEEPCSASGWAVVDWYLSGNIRYGRSRSIPCRSRITISLGVIMFELTGELEYVLPNTTAILIAKWIADAISKEGVYDVAQTVLGHPFLDLNESVRVVQKRDALVRELIPPKQTMDEITLHVPKGNKVLRSTLETVLRQLKNRGLMDAGLVLTQDDNVLRGYLAQAELDFGLNELERLHAGEIAVRVLEQAEKGDYDLSVYVDKTPLSICETAPLEYAVEMFAKLGLRHLMVTEDRTGRITGVIIKKRLVAYLDKV